MCIHVRDIICAQRRPLINKIIFKLKTLRQLRIMCDRKTTTAFALNGSMFDFWVNWTTYNSSKLFAAFEWFTGRIFVLHIDVRRSGVYDNMLIRIRCQHKKKTVEENPLRYIRIFVRLSSYISFRSARNLIAASCNRLLLETKFINCAFLKSLRSVSTDLTISTKTN